MRFCWVFCGIFFVAREGRDELDLQRRDCAAAETHVSESRRGAPALVTHLRPGPPAERLSDKVRAMNFGEKSWLSIAQQTMEVYTRVLFGSK